MTWFRLDDKFHSNSKTIEAGNAAVGLWTRCGTWSADHLKDGFVPDHVAKSFGTPKEIGTLTRVGFWTPIEGGYMIPDYLDFNPSAIKVNAERHAATERQRKAREAATSRRDNSVSDATVTVPPTRPDPTRSEQVLTNSTPVDTPTLADGIDSRRNQVADHYARIALEHATGITHPRAYRNKARTTALAHPDLDPYLHRWPTAPPDAIAAWLHGTKHSMSYYPDTTDPTES